MRCGVRICRVRGRNLESQRCDFFDGRGEGADLGAPRRPRRGRAARTRAGAGTPVRRHRAVGGGAGAEHGAGDRPPPPAHRARVLAALVLLNLIELCGVWLLGPGFWIGSAPSLALLGAYLVHLRNRALVERQRRRATARHAAWLAARQAELRREQTRRAAARRE